MPILLEAIQHPKPTRGQILNLGQFLLSGRLCSFLRAKDDFQSIDITCLEANEDKAKEFDNSQGGEDWKTGSEPTLTTLLRHTDSLSDAYLILRTMAPIELQLEARGSGNRRRRDRIEQSRSKGSQSTFQLSHQRRIRHQDSNGQYCDTGQQPQTAPTEEERGPNWRADCSARRTICTSN